MTQLLFFDPQVAKNVVPTLVLNPTEYSKRFEQETFV